MGLVFVAAGPAFLSLFTKEPAVVEAGMSKLSIMGLSYSVSAFMDCSVAASRSLGKSLVPTIILILGSCVFRIIWIYTIFAYFHTIPALYLLYIFSWTITSIARRSPTLFTPIKKKRRICRLRQKRRENGQNGRVLTRPFLLW